MKLLLRVVLVLAATATVHAEWQHDPEVKLERRAAAALERFRAKPRLKKYFAQAHGYAVFPRIVEFGAGFGGAYGKGVVIDEQDRMIATSKLGQFTTGIIFGVHGFSLIVFFKDAEALEYYKKSKLQFTGRAAVTFVDVGAAADPAYNAGVAVFALPTAGLMIDAAVSGSKFTFKPVER